MPALSIRILRTLQHDPEPVLSTSDHQNLFPVRFSSCTICIMNVLFDRLDKSSIMKIFVSKFLMGTTELLLVVILKVVYRITKISNKVRRCYTANSILQHKMNNHNFCIKVWVNCKGTDQFLSLLLLLLLLLSFFFCSSHLF